MTSESIECPLCMEPMDFDDVDFYPCPCRYQICRFCWDKILNEENGLCPACRKPYNSEHPASYKPRTEEEIKNKIKHSKKVCIKKTKPVPEGKEYLSEYRVLQKNLIFVVGLPMRMADEVELLKGSEYFGRCGKVYKIVINQNQTFPGPQGTPCLSAYVTYHRNEDALKTLVDLKKLEIDGRAVKLSLGTTKYCSQFLRNRRCTKQDCMYLHEMGDLAASFTKEDMANGKHTEYENQLIQEFYDNQKIPVLPPSPIGTINGLSISLNNNIVEHDKGTVQRKSSLSNSQTMSCVSCIPSSAISAAVTTSPIVVTPSLIKSQRTGLITPIGTDPIDASKIYSVSSDNCHSSKSLLNKVTISSTITSQSTVDPYNLGKDSQSSILNSESLETVCDIVVGGSSRQMSPPTRPDLSFVHQNNPTDSQTNQSLLDSFYFLNSQVTNGGNINQQVNNNGLTNFSLLSTNLTSHTIGNSDQNNSTERKHKDNADIDFDPINISRLGLAELIANENRQKMTSYQVPQIYSNQQRNLMRSSGHEFLMQSNTDFYNSNCNGTNTSSSLSHRMSNQSFLHEKQSISQQINSTGLNNSFPVTVAPISSGYPSPPPGFEVNHSCIGEQPSNEIMNMIHMNHNSSEMYNRYQNQHSSPDIPIGMNQHNSNYSNQYSMPPRSNYHNEYSGGYSNGGSSMMPGYSNDINSQSHPWKQSGQSMFCDSNVNNSLDMPHTTTIGIRSSAAAAAAAAAATAYNRSHSMNDTNTGIRNSEWNGFASYNNTNDSHMSNYPFY